MTEYIERTEELMLAMNAGARAIENTKRYHGAVYTKDLFSGYPGGAVQELSVIQQTEKAYAELCLDDAKDDKHLDLTKGVIDRELERVMGSNFKPWEERYPKEVFEK